MGLQEVKEGVLRKLGPQKHRPQTPKNSHPLGVSKTQTLNSIFFKCRYYWVPLTFNQLWIISERKKGGFVILAPCHYIVYTIEMNKQVSCFQIWIWSGMISLSDSGWLWHYPFLQGMTGHFKTSASFSVCWIRYEKFPTTYMYIRGDLENICVLEIILLC